MTRTVRPRAVVCQVVFGVSIALFNIGSSFAQEPPPGAPPPMPAAEPAPTMPTMAPAPTLSEPNAQPTAAARTGGPRVGGHVGVAVPLVTFSNAPGAKSTSTVSDAFTLAVPIGISVKLTDNLVVDFETIVANHIDPNGATELLVDPGIVYNWGAVATGLRAVMGIGAPRNFGLIPLINKGLVDFGGGTWFIEAAFPVRDIDGDFSLDMVLHTGIGF